MTQLWRSVAVIAGPGCLLWVALISYASTDAYLLGNCDPKFGCTGSVQVSAFVASLAWLCSVMGHLPVCVVFRGVVHRARFWWLIGAIVILSFGQGALFASSGTHLPGSTLFGMMAAWSGLSALFALVVLAVMRRWAPNNSFKPNPLRGSA
jgi:hypothetical protein